MITFLGDVALISEGLKSEYIPEDRYVFNLEYVIGSKDKLQPIPGKINLISDRHNFADIFGKAPIAVSVANNHSFDFGADGLDGTLEIISGEKIGIIGKEPYCADDDLFLISYTALDCCGGFEFDFDKAANDIALIKKRNSEASVIVQMHWGIENHPCNNKKQTEIAHWLIDNGVDLVIGHHPHCIQPIEEYKGKYIFYSLGNGLFPNISQDSYYNENGVPMRKYRFKWQSWNRKSYAVSYDETKKSVAYVDVLYQKKNTLTCKKKRICVGDASRDSRCGKSKFRYMFRKYYLFFVSNFMVDGKLFDLNAVKCELKK